MNCLILMRHAKTEPWTEGIDDHARALTARGHEAAKAIAAELASQELTPDLALVSTARRTRETWAHVSQAFPDCDVILDEDLYLAGERGLRDAISDHDTASCVMLIGHNPGIHDLALTLSREAGTLDYQSAVRLAAKMPTGGTAVFKPEMEDGDVSSGLKLSQFIRPKDLIET